MSGKYTGPVRQALVENAQGQFVSIAVVATRQPAFGPGDDGALWIDVGEDGSRDEPLLRMYDAGTDSSVTVCRVPADVLTLVAHAAIGNDAPHHEPVTAGDHVAVSGQQVSVVDGAGSGLDADLLDGSHAADFAAAGHTHFDDSEGDPANVAAAAADGVSAYAARRDHVHTLADEVVSAEHIDSGESWGESQKKLLNLVPYSSSYDVLRIDSASDSSFSALINGTPSGTSVVYDTVTGNENSIVPAASTQIGKLVLRNTTRGTSAKISAVNTSTNTITVTSAADISGWADNDAITVNSATCVNPGGPPYYFDLDLSGFLPSTATAVVLQWSFKDSGTAGTAIGILHPYEAYADKKTKAIRTQLAGAWLQTGADAIVPVVSQKICVYLDASGSATASIYLRISGWFEEAAT